MSTPLTPILEAEDVLAYRCADGTDFGVFVSRGRASGTHTYVTSSVRTSTRRWQTCGRPG